MSAYRIDRAEAEAHCVEQSIKGMKAVWVNRNNTRFLTPRAVRTEQASSVTEAAQWHVSLQGRDPPIHVPPPFTCASGPHGDWHILLLLAVSLRSRFAGSLAALFTVPVTRNGIQVSVGIYSNHVSRDRRSWA